jgi:hypothetical protein
MLVNIYDGRFEPAPAGGLDNIRYYAQAVGDLAEQCPALGLDVAKYSILPYIVANMRETIARVQSGKGTASELMQFGWARSPAQSAQTDSQVPPSQMPAGLPSATRSG